MRIPLVVLSPETHGTPRAGEPITIGVPCPKGTVATPQWMLEGADGSSVAADARVIERWPDGSARWVLVDTTMAPAFIPAPPVLCPLPDALPADTQRLSYEERPDGLTIDTGAARFSFRVGGAFPFDHVELGGAAVLAVDSPRGLVVTDSSGRAHESVVEHIRIEHQGTLRTSVLSRGSIRLGARTIEIDVRVDLYAGLTGVRIRSTVRNPEAASHPGNYWDLGDPGSILLKDVSLVLPLAATPHDAERPLIHYSAELGVEWATATGGLEIYQDSSGGENWQSSNHINRERRVPNTFRGYRVVTPGHRSTGLRATPAVVLERGALSLGASVPTFWQNFPMAIEADDQRLIVRLFAGQYADLHELQGGEQKTHDITLSFGGAAQGSHAFLEWARDPTRLAASPEWVTASGAFDFLAPLEHGHASLVDQAIDGEDTFVHKREVVDQYGWRNFGDVYGDHETVGHTGPTPLVSHYNNQYDPVLGFGLQFLRTGDHRWWSAMDELARHIVDIDIYHTSRDKSAYNGGLFWHTYHYGDADTATHRTYPAKNTGTVSGGGPSADHNYPTGLLLHYLLTGNEASRQAAIGLAQYAINIDDGNLSRFRLLSRADTGQAHLTFPDYYGPARASGNSLNALVDGHRLTGDAKFLSKADQLVFRVVHPDDDQKQHRLDEPEYRWFYAMFLQALGKYLHYKAAIGQRDRAYAHGRESLIAYARWMAEHEYPYLTKPEKLEYPTETWAAQDVRKADIFCFAAMHVDGSLRELFLERAAFFHRTSVDMLQSMPTKSFARPIIVMLGSGALLEWVRRHPDATEPPPDYKGDIGPLRPFVPQRTIAKRRAIILLAAGAASAVAVVGAGLYWWLNSGGGA